MKDKYSDIYDWCFSIDIDEFITIENNINDTLSLYKDYDAVVLRWKCYGADNHIYQPDYSKVGVIDSFTKEMSGIVREKPSCLCKTCFNIKNYKPEFFGTPHSPKETCNYCNTDFIKSDIIPSYNKMYIRHYITKSWEEYVYKLQVRGFMWGGRRNFDFFFDVNPELRNRKEELLSQIDGETLIVLPYKQSGSQGNEIRIALNGWRKFCRSKYHFVVIGEFKDDLKEEFPWVEFIYELSVPKIPGQYYPHLDIQHKMEVAYNLFKDRYKGFIYMVDDNYAIKPFYIYELKTIYYHQPSFVGREEAPVNWWKHDKWKTRQLMDRENFTHVNYTTHFPCYFEFERFKELWDKFNMREESYVPEDVYFNSYKHQEPILDSTIRLGVWSKEIFENDFQNAVRDPKIKFICNSVEGWSKELEEELNKIVRKEE